MLLFVSLKEISYLKLKTQYDKRQEDNESNQVSTRQDNILADMRVA